MVLGGEFVKADLSDEKKLKETFEKHHINAVMHFAASCLVSESVKSPHKHCEMAEKNWMFLTKREIGSDK